MYLVENLNLWRCDANLSGKWLLSNDQKDQNAFIFRVKQSSLTEEDCLTLKMEA
jgi:hypothetical protein